MPIVIELQPVQAVSMLIIVIILIVIGLELRQQKSNWLWFMPVVFWMLHGLLFYGLLFAERFNWIATPVSFTQWSSILRLHGYLTILSVEIARWLQNKIKGRG